MYSRWMDWSATNSEGDEDAIKTSMEKGVCAEKMKGKKRISRFAEMEPVGGEV